MERQHQKNVATANKVFVDIDAATDETWPKFLPAVQRMLNTRTHSATGFAPHHLVFGTAMTECAHALEGDIADISLVITTPVPTYVKELDNSLSCKLDFPPLRIESQRITCAVPKWT